jgi:hypothetical protein
MILQFQTIHTLYLVFFYFRKQLEALDMLFACLQQRAFNGELSQE